VVSFPSIITGITNSSLEESLLKMYPVPTSGVLHFEGLDPESSYTVMDYKGALIKRGILISQQVDVQELSSGLYLITLSNKSGSISKKFIKE
jgi:hypothetical protein